MRLVSKFLQIHTADSDRPRMDPVFTLLVIQAYATENGNVQTGAIESKGLWLPPGGVSLAVSSASQNTSIREDQGKE